MLTPVPFPLFFSTSLVISVTRTVRRWPASSPVSPKRADGMPDVAISFMCCALSPSLGVIRMMLSTRSAPP